MYPSIKFPSLAEGRIDTSNICVCLTNCLFILQKNFDEDLYFLVLYIKLYSTLDVLVIDEYILISSGCENPNNQKKIQCSVVDVFYF